MDHTGKRKWRIVIDFHLLNEKTIGNAYTLPNISEILDHLGRAQYFSVFDLASGFHQIELDPADRPKTAFSSLNGHYEYVRMPMGLKNSPSTFQRLLDQVLVGLQGTELFVYLDDIVPIPDISVATIAHALAKNLISQYGTPKAILTDKGKGFVNNLLSSKIFGIKQITTLGYRPQSSGSLERSHAVLMDYVRAYAENYDDWDQLLPFAMFAYNTSVHSATKFTPFELIFGK